MQIEIEHRVDIDNTSDDDRGELMAMMTVLNGTQRESFVHE